MGFIHHTLVHAGESERKTGAFEERKELGLSVISLHLKRRHGDGAFGLFESRDDGADCCLHFCWVAFAPRNIQQAATLYRGALNRHEGIVLGDQEIGRFAEAKGLTDQTFHFCHDVVRSDMGADPAACCGDIKKVAIDPVAEGVVSD